jgi:hypothetical protein
MKAQKDVKISGCYLLQRDSIAFFQASKWRIIFKVICLQPWEQYQRFQNKTVLLEDYYMFLVKEHLSWVHTLQDHSVNCITMRTINSNIENSYSVPIKALSVNLTLYGLCKIYSRYHKTYTFKMNMSTQVPHSFKIFKTFLVTYDITSNSTH